MKTSLFTHTLRHGLLAIVLLAAGLLFSSKANASCTAKFTYTINNKVVTFTNTSSGASTAKYYWVFGDGTSSSSANPVHTYGSSYTTYIITLYMTDSLGSCNDSFKAAIRTGSSCSVLQSHKTSLLAVSFDDSASTALLAGHKHSVTWSFGDGSAYATNDKPTHTYSKAGTYVVNMYLYDSVAACGAYSTETLTVSTCTLVVSYKFSVNARKVTFTSSTTSASKHSRYTWIFGDGSAKDSTTGYTVSHTYTGTPTTYSSYLIIYDSATGCTNYASQTVTLCTINSAFSSKMSGLSVAFKSDSALAKSVKYKWSFGDNTTSDSKNPSHTYSTSGTYYVCLTIVDSVNVCSTTTCSSITVSSCTMIASFTHSQAAYKVSFTSTTSASSHTKYLWYFGDGTKDSSGKSVSHTYSSTKTVTAYLTVYDSATKCTASTSESISFCNLFAQWNYSASQLKVSFKPDSANASTVKYAWDFGDKTTSKDKSPNHSFSTSGSYYVCLTVTDSTLGCHESYCMVIVVKACTLSAAYTFTQSGRKVSFTSTNSASHYVWNFGDGNKDSTSGKTVSHTYGGSTKNYTATLTVYDSSGKCDASVSHTIAFCSVSAKFSTVVNGGIVSFSHDASNASNTKYAWSFGDGTYNTDKNPKHTYSKTGTYYVCEQATDSPCTETHCDSIKITTLSSTWCISGTVTAGGAVGFPCRVWLITYNSTDSSLKAIDSMDVKDTTGKYSFCGLGNGTYYTKAALSAKHAYYKYFIPTYHNDATKWAKAKAVTVSGADETGVDIKMVKGTNPGGAGFIGGKIKAGANKTGDPEVGVEVTLYDVNDVEVGYTYTDNNGEYSFAGIAFGTYTVYVDVIGKTCVPASVVVDETDANKLHIDWNINVQNIALDKSAIKTADWKMENVNIYPNPVTDKLLIATNLASSQEVNIKITDITGKLVSEMNQTLTGGSQTIEVDANTLLSGMYFIKLQLQKDNKILEARFVKAQ